MKKYFIILLMLLSSRLLFSQSQSEAIGYIRKEIKSSRNSLPRAMGPVTVQKVAIVDGIVAAECTVSDDSIDIDNVFSVVSSPVASGSFVCSLISGSSEVQKMLSLSGLHVRAVFKGSATSRRRELFLASDIINDGYRRVCSRDSVRNIADRINAGLPRSLGGDLVLTSIMVGDRFVTYKVRTDSRTLTIPMMKLVKNTSRDMEESILEGLVQAPDESTRRFRDHLIQGGFDVKYIYWTRQNDETVDFVVTSQEIKNGLKK